jgi:UDP-glucose-4-epimerase GalE
MPISKRSSGAGERSLTKSSVLVVGGAGYIGSHMVKRLARSGHAVTTLDNLSLGHRDAVVAGDFVHGDLLDEDGLARLFGRRRFDLVMHFAASAAVGESVQHPRAYYSNNVVGALNLLGAMLDAGVRRFIFSSTCATYGVPEEIPITESHPQRPINPYGNTKLVIERALADYGAAYGLSSVALRYFNAAGCDREGELDERHSHETHLIPLILREAARVEAGGDRDATTLTVFGDDYPTADGTCVRDYIHVDDLCGAHLLAAERLLRGGAVNGFDCFNLGNGAGSSVLQVIAAARAVTGVDFVYRVAGRRPGDPPVLVGSAAKAAEVLGWRPEIPHIAEIVETAWRAMKRRGPPLRIHDSVASIAVMCSSRLSRP